MNKNELINEMVRNGFITNKSMGQNFLYDDKYIKRIVELLKLEDGDFVIEIGPGYGSLTKEILKNNVTLLAYDIDERVVDYLNSSLTGDFKIIKQDFLKVDLNEFVGKKIKIVSNIPYYITTEILEKVFTSSLEIEKVVFMVQKEVESRLMAKLGDTDYRPLNQIMNYVGNLTPCFVVPKISFVPAPHIDSKVFLLSMNGNKVDGSLYRFITRLYLNKRKTVLNNLTAIVNNKEEASKYLKECGITENLRPQAMSIKMFVDLYKLVEK